MPNETARRAEFDARRARWAASALLALVATAGCNGSGRVSFTSLDFEAIDPPAPRIITFDLQQCAWTIERDGRVIIAMKRAGGALLGVPTSIDLRLALTLDKLPAGAARSYAVSEDMLHATLRMGPARGATTALAGVVALYRESGDRLRGALRIQAENAALGIFGWSEARPVLLLAEFVAVRDDKAAGEIAAAAQGDVALTSP